MKKSIVSRRKFLEKATAAAAFSMIPSGYFFSDRRRIKKPNSKIAGVQLGLTTYSYLSMPHKVDDVIGYLLSAGISSIELRSVAEEDLGIPQASRAGSGGGRGAALSEEAKVARAKAAADLRTAQREWRLSLPMNRYVEMRKKFNDAGINIHISKFAPSEWSDEEIDYAFNAAKALGSYGVSDEAGEAACKRLGAFAAKHKSLAIYHTHGQFAQPGFDIGKLLDYSPANRLNFDVGHYFGSTGLHPNPIIEKYHDRISSIHIKDMTGPKSNPPNAYAVMGKGETPVADVLLLIKKNKWPINVDLELETPAIPEGSDAAKEVVRCIEYMKAILE